MMMAKQMTDRVRTKQQSIWLILMPVVFVVIILDQVSKYLISHFMQLGQSYPLCPWLNLDFQYNRGAAFSFLDQSSSWQIYLLILIAILMSIGMVFWLLRQSKQSKWQIFAISLIVGGAIGNLIDRVRLGYVIDFIDFHIKNWHYAIFNVADSAITIGVILLMILLLFSRNKKQSF